MPRTPGWRRCGPRPSGCGPRTPTCGPAAPTRPGSSATSPWNVTQRRLADLDIGDAPLCSAASTWRTGPAVRRADRRGRRRSTRPLVVDWRAPVSEPFYRATAVEPMDVVRRRHSHLAGRAGSWSASTTRCSTSRRIDEAGLPIVGEGALLAALERNRTGRMGDIVATIQAEQDEAIRAEVAGPLVVAGGPGTGKTRGRAPPSGLPAVHVPAPPRRAAACCWSARARCSCATSSTCCRRSASKTCSCRRSPACGPASGSGAPIPTRPRH